MTVDTERQSNGYEQTILSIMRRLPMERLPYLVEYARFLEYQAVSSSDISAVSEDSGLDGDAKWDRLLAKPESKHVLREMAREARAEYIAEDTNEFDVTDDDRLTAK